MDVRRIKGGGGFKVDWKQGRREIIETTFRKNDKWELYESRYRVSEMFK